MPQPLIKLVLERYRTSRDFNGLYFNPDSDDLRAEAIELTKKGLVQVVSEDDYPNPHIRPWPSKRTVEQQVESIMGLQSDSFGLCLYPTPNALKKYRVRNKFTNQPYSLDMSMGKGTLELAHFRFEVLEPYRNDPKFDFDFDDFGVSICITSEADLDMEESDDEKILIKHVGFSYDFSKSNIEDPTTPIYRRVCAFYGDLAKLSPSHQQRWRSYQVNKTPTLEPHPIWWSQQMGHWPDGIGPFYRFFSELNSLNELHQRAFGTQLFRSIDRPQEFGWIMRPSQQEWDTFIHQLDKLLSDNIVTEALDAMKAPRKDETGNDLGTLKRLEKILSSKGIPKDVVADVLKPLFEIRSARQKPAHTISINTANNEFIHRQIAMMGRVNGCLENLRRFWQQHPLNADWKEPDYLSEDAKYYRT